MTQPTAISVDICAQQYYIYLSYNYMSDNKPTTHETKRIHGINICNTIGLYKSGPVKNLTYEPVMKSTTKPRDYINYTFNIEYCFRNKICGCCRPIFVRDDDNDNMKVKLLSITAMPVI